jgi:hypothetical protein
MTEAAAAPAGEPEVITAKAEEGEEGAVVEGEAKPEAGKPGEAKAPAAGAAGKAPAAGAAGKAPAAAAGGKAPAAGAAGKTPAAGAGGKGPAAGAAGKAEAKPKAKPEAKK